MNTKTKLLTRSGLLIALGIILPFIAHMTGIGGRVLLPMHLPPLLAGFLVGPFYALVVGFILPPLNMAVSGMPPMPTMALMSLELAVFGLITGLLYKKINVFLSLLAAMLTGRIVYYLAFALFIEFGNPLIMMGSGIVTGLPGIISQLVLVPVIVYALEQREQTYTSLVSHSA